MIRLSIMTDQGNVESWWKHLHQHVLFIQLEGKRNRTNPAIGTYTKLREAELKKWGARISEFGISHYLEFENEHDATLFLMRWS